MKVSTNYNRGAAVKDIAELQRLTKSKKAIYHSVRNKLIPASVMISQSVREIQKQIDKKLIYRIVKIK